jgi:hypothetical protein
MSKPRFLIDENLARFAIVDGIRLRNPAIDVLFVGGPGAPPLQTPDPAILEYCEQTQRMLVTDNRESMPAHVADSFAAGRHHWGILTVRKGRRHDIGGIIDSLELNWALEEAEDYADREAWIPL